MIYETREPGRTPLKDFLKILAWIHGAAGFAAGIYFIHLAFPSDQAEYAACAALDVPVGPNSTIGQTLGQGQIWMQCLNDFAATRASLAGQWWAIGLGIILEGCTMAAILWTLSELLPKPVTNDTTGGIDAGGESKPMNWVEWF